MLHLQGTFVLFWLAYLLTLACGILLAYIIAVLSPNMDVANAALPGYVVRPPLPLVAAGARTRRATSVAVFCARSATWQQT
jgi:hypothetical protein